MPLAPKHKLTLPGGGVLSLARPVIVGILNVTPDSFSDGGDFVDESAAIRRGLEMIEEGAAVIDVGGESTRPGSSPVPVAEQKRRVLGVIRGLARQATHISITASASTPPATAQFAAISIDTRSAEVAAAAIAAGAGIINDVSAGQDPAMFALAAKCGTPIVLMHMRGLPHVMQINPQYENVVTEVRQYLFDRAAAAQTAGVPKEQIIIDPGIGFGKTIEHNLTLLANLHDLTATEYSVMLGTSRKMFLGAVAASATGYEPPGPRERIAGTCVTTALGVAAGVHLFRVHDVRANRQAAEVAWAIQCRM